jgi:hypothetical protein
MPGLIVLATFADETGAGNVRFLASAELAREPAPGCELGLPHGAGPPQRPTARTMCSTRMTNRDHRCDVAARPLAPGESQGVVTTGRRSYRRYDTA